MESEKKWMELCELAATEKDSAKLLTLVQEINRLLAERDKSAKANLRSVPPPPMPNLHKGFEQPYPSAHNEHFMLSVSFFAHEHITVHA
jgi:hypothetical protein